MRGVSLHYPFTKSQKTDPSQKHLDAVLLEDALINKICGKILKTDRDRKHFSCCCLEIANESQCFKIQFYFGF